MSDFWHGHGHTRGLTNRPREPRLLSDVQVTVSTDIDVVSISELKDFLEVTHTEDDAQIQAHLNTALDFFDRVAGHRLDEQTRRATFDQDFHLYELPSKPVTSIDAVKTSYQGTETAQDASNFFLYADDPPEVRTKTGHAWNSPLDSVIIDYVCGYADANDVPSGIVEVIKKMVSDLYENRTSESQEGNVPRELAMNWKQLITPYMIIKL
jgi:uncharacterized phiE125 gp8 family phage protein